MLQRTSNNAVSAGASGWRQASKRPNARQPAAACTAIGDFNVPRSAVPPG
jgi:hypothetical protein